MIAENKPPDDGLEDVKLLNAKALAGCLSVSVRQAYRMNKAGLIPAPLRIGGVVRWRAAEIAAWLQAGSPERAAWESSQQVKTEAGVTT